MKVIPKYYLAEEGDFHRVSPYFNTLARAIAYQKKHHFFGNIVYITPEEFLKRKKGSNNYDDKTDY